MGNFLALEDRPTTVDAWLAATAALSGNGNRAYNLVYSIINPGRLSDKERRIIKIFDAFALSHGLHSVETVANTIFPLDTYLSQGGENFYAYYLKSVYPKVRKQWGTYFERMTRRSNDDGTFMAKNGVPLNPLARLVDKIGRRVDGTGRTTTHYELAIDDPFFEVSTYDPRHDGEYQVGGPCLSHLSFKLDNAGALRLTALYRSHWYIARALGNLVGLARLQAFVAKQSNTKVGPLTVIASEAVLDLSASGRSAGDTRAMLKACEAALSLAQ